MKTHLRDTDRIVSFLEAVMFTMLHLMVSLFSLALSYQSDGSTVSLGCVSCASSDSFSCSVARQGDFLGVSISHTSWSDSTRSSSDAASSMTACEECELELRN